MTSSGRLSVLDEHRLGFLLGPFVASGVERGCHLESRDELLFHLVMKNDTLCHRLQQWDSSGACQHL